MADLRKIKDKAAEAAAKGKLEKAASLYRDVLEEDPGDVATRQKLADVLRRAGDFPEAIETYREVADRFARDGLLVKAIAISKTILELDPDHVETQSALAELYARKTAAESKRPPVRGTLMMAAVRAPPPAPLSAGKAIVPPPPAAPACDPEDTMVEIPLGPATAPGAAVPPPLPVSGSAELVGPPLGDPFASGDEAGPGEPATPFGEILSAAAASREVGVEEEIVLDVDPADFAGADELDPYVPPETSTGVAAPPAAPVHAASPGAPDTVPVVVSAAAAGLSAPRDSAPARPEQPAPPVPAAPGLPRVPIFSDLSREAFIDLARGMVLHRVAAGEAVILEGDTGTSFFVVATGRLAVSRRDEHGDEIVVAHLKEGDFFGEMALLSGAPRAATVTAEEPGEVLELGADVLADVARRHPHVAQSLRRFYRQRLLANAMAVSAVFRPFGRGDRKLIMERFKAREVRAGELVIREGTPSDGLYVVLEGAVDVVKRTAGGDAPVGRLREGDVFGEISCLRKTPASASVVVARAGTLLRLPRSDFDWLVVTYPQVLEHVSELTEERSENLDAILSGRAQWTDEGLVLV